MEAYLELDTEWLQGKVVRFFSPKGLTTVVILFSGSGIEHRTMDGPGSGIFDSQHPLAGDT